MMTPHEYLKDGVKYPIAILSYSKNEGLKVLECIEKVWPNVNWRTGASPTNFTKFTGACWFVINKKGELTYTTSMPSGYTKKHRIDASDFADAINEKIKREGKYGI